MFRQFHTTAVSFAAALFLFVLTPKSPAQSTEKGPSVDVVKAEIDHPLFFSMTPDGRLISSGKTPAAETNSDGTHLYEWVTNDGSLAATYGKDDQGVWRLTESSKYVRGTKTYFKADTATFYPTGVRSKTYCVGLAGTTPECFTASRKFCSIFKKRSEDWVKDPANLASTALKTAVQTGKFEEYYNRCLGFTDDLKSPKEICDNYVKLLAKTLNPNVNLNESERSERDEHLVSPDLNAIKALKNNATRALVGSMGDLDAWRAKDDKVGASSTGMKNRIERLESLKPGDALGSKEMVAMSHLANVCGQTKFAAAPGEAWQIETPKPPNHVVPNKFKTEQ